jgi:hypothetical protein
MSILKELINEVYLPHFQKHGEGAIPSLVNSRVSRICFLSAYKQLPPIEEMPEEEKKEMKAYVISLFPNKTTAEKLEACKIVYCIGTLL